MMYVCTYVCMNVCMYVCMGMIHLGSASVMKLFWTLDLFEDDLRRRRKLVRSVGIYIYIYIHTYIDRYYTPHHPCRLLLSYDGPFLTNIIIVYRIVCLYVCMYVCMYAGMLKDHHMRWPR